MSDLEEKFLASQLTLAREEIVALNDEVEEQAAGRRHIQDTLSAEIDVLTFKVSNLTTERDVANQEIERLKDKEHGVTLNYLDADKERVDLQSQLTAKDEEIERLKRQDEVHWKTRRTLLKEIESLKQRLDDQAKTIRQQRTDLTETEGK